MTGSSKGGALDAGPGPARRRSHPAEPRTQLGAHLPARRRVRAGNRRVMAAGA